MIIITLTVIISVAAALVIWQWNEKDCDIGNINDSEKYGNEALRTMVTSVDKWEKEKGDNDDRDSKDFKISLVIL